MMKLLSSLLDGKENQKHEIAQWLSLLEQGHWNDGQIAAVLVHWNHKKITSNELLAGASYFYEKGLPLFTPSVAFIDLSKNLGPAPSIASSLIADALGVSVAQPLRRSLFTKFGTADLLEAKKFPMNHTKESLTSSFYYIASSSYSSLRATIGCRRSILTLTYLDVLMPYIFPVMPQSMVICLESEDLMNQMMHAFSRLEHWKQIIFVLRDSFKIFQLKQGQKPHLLKMPGVSAHRKEDHGSLLDQLEFLDSLLKGKSSPYLEEVLCYASLMYFIQEKESDLQAIKNFIKKNLLEKKAIDFFNQKISPDFSLKN